MILESIVTSTNLDGSLNVSPMGPNVGDGSMDRFELRPFDTSRTFQNLKREKVGVLHVTDDCELFALSAIGRLSMLPDTVDADQVDCKVLSGACRAYEFVVEYVDETGPRMNLNCKTVKVHWMRDFWGFNRGKNAILEAAILATRIQFIPADFIRQQFEQFVKIVEKTGGKSEKRAMEHLIQFAESTLEKSSGKV
ncbi:MAG: DUF447 domain-containing protein [Planctomycetota bacterium]